MSRSGNKNRILFGWQLNDAVTKVVFGLTQKGKHDLEAKKSKHAFNISGSSEETRKDC